MITSSNSTLKPMRNNYRRSRIKRTFSKRSISRISRKRIKKSWKRNCIRSTLRWSRRIWSRRSWTGISVSSCTSISVILTLRISPLWRRRRKCELKSKWRITNWDTPISGTSRNSTWNTTWSGSCWINTIWLVKSRNWVWKTILSMKDRHLRFWEKGSWNWWVWLISLITLTNW